MLPKLPTASAACRACIHQLLRRPRHLVRPAAPALLPTRRRLHASTALRFESFGDLKPGSGREADEGAPVADSLPRRPPAPFKPAQDPLVGGAGNAPARTAPGRGPRRAPAANAAANAAAFGVFSNAAGAASLPGLPVSDTLDDSMRVNEAPNSVDVGQAYNVGDTVNEAPPEPATAAPAEPVTEAAASVVNPVHPQDTKALADALRLKETVDAGDIRQAYALLQEIVGVQLGVSAQVVAPAVARGPGVVSKTLREAINGLLELMFRRNEEIRGVPSRLEFFRQLMDHGLANEPTRRLGLLCLLQEGADPAKELLPAFEAAVRGEAQLAADADVTPETELPAQMFTWPGLPEPHVALYAAFLRLWSAEVRTPLLEAVHAQIYTRLSIFKLFSRFLRDARVPAPEELVWLANSLNARKLLATPLIRRKLAPLVEQGKKSQIDAVYTLVPIYQPLPESTYTAFIAAYCELGRPSHPTALRVWGDMVAAGHTPSVTSWTELLAGLARGGDPAAALKAWSHMVDSGVQPDIYAWNARIYAHFAADDVAGGIAALRALLASKTVRPNTITINTCVAGLLRAGRGADARAVLALARTHNVPLDTASYNTLMHGLLLPIQSGALSPAAARAALHDALKVLQLMQAAGVAPDVITITTMVDGVARLVARVAPRDAPAQLLGLLDELQRAGVALNVATYTALLDGLHAAGAGAWAVGAVRGSMAARRVFPTPPTYGVLLRIAFGSGDAHAPQALVDEMVAAGVRWDAPLFQEAAFGFARRGDLDWVRWVREVMAAEAFVPRLAMAVGVARALLQFQARDEAAEWLELARERIEADDVGGAAGDGMRMVKERYWECAAETWGAEWARERRRAVEAATRAAN